MALRSDIELFHLLFIKTFLTTQDKSLIVLKGGCNLRFFLGSNRYSEDIDFDVTTISRETLKKRVNKILSSQALGTSLAARKIHIVTHTAPKQTDTVQRWKVTIHAQSLDIPTKIEFSRRGIDDPIAFECVDSVLMREYQITPFLASHYPPEAAFLQKVHALIHRSQTQARDVFDLAHLLRSGVTTRGMELPPRWREAQQNALSVSFDVFKSQVLAFLSPDHQAQYDDPQMWDDLVLRVVEALKGEAG